MVRKSTLSLQADSSDPSPSKSVAASSICNDHNTTTLRPHSEVDLSKSAIIRPIPQPVEDVATVLFLANYAPMSKLSSVLSPHSLHLSNPALDALRATSLAYPSMTLSPSTSNTLAHTTFATYGIALSHKNSSLADPSFAVTDMTLLAVLLLALFECLALRGQCSRTAWLAHNCGVLALLRLRKRQRGTIFSPQARELDRLATRQVRVAGVLRAEPAQLRTGDQTEQGETAAEHRVNRLLDHIIKLRLLTQSSDDVKALLKVARRTRELDVDIVSRSAWPLPRPDPGPEYARAAGSWLTMRIIRFFLNHKFQSQTFDTDDPELINEAIAIRTWAARTTKT